MKPECGSEPMAELNTNDSTTKMAKARDLGWILRIFARILSGLWKGKRLNRPLLKLRPYCRHVRGRYSYFATCSSSLFQPRQKSLVSRRATSKADCDELGCGCARHWLICAGQKYREQKMAQAAPADDYLSRPGLVRGQQLSMRWRQFSDTLYRNIST